MGEKYYLYLQKGGASYERYSRACIRALEYGVLYGATEEKVVYLQEHGTCMIEEKAILPIFNTIQHTATLILAFYSIWRVNSLLAPILLLVAIITMFFEKIYSIG